MKEKTHKIMRFIVFLLLLAVVVVAVNFGRGGTFKGMIVLNPQLNNVSDQEFTLAPFETQENLLVDFENRDLVDPVHPQPVITIKDRIGDKVIYGSRYEYKSEDFVLAFHITSAPNTIPGTFTIKEVKVNFPYNNFNTPSCFVKSWDGKEEEPFMDGRLFSLNEDSSLFPYSPGKVRYENKIIRSLSYLPNEKVEFGRGDEMTYGLAMNSKFCGIHNKEKAEIEWVKYEWKDKYGNSGIDVTRNILNSYDDSYIEYFPYE